MLTALARISRALLLIGLVAWPLSAEVVRIERFPSYHFVNFP